MAGDVPENRETIRDQASAARHGLFWEALALERIGKGLFEEDRAGCNKTPCKVCTWVATSERHAFLGSGFWSATYSGKAPAERCSAKWWLGISTEWCFRKVWNYRRAGCGQYIVFRPIFSKSFDFLTAHKSSSRETQRTFQNIGMKTSMCQARLEPGRRFWQFGMWSTTLCEQSGEDSIHLPEPVSELLLHSLASQACKIFPCQRLPRTSYYKGLFWCMHPMTVSWECKLKTPASFWRNWRSCRMIWFLQFLIRPMKYSERIKAYSRKFVPRASWFSQTFHSPSYWKTSILKCGGWISRRSSAAQSELCLEQGHFNCKMVSQLHVLAQLVLHWNHSSSRCPRGMMVDCLLSLRITQWKLCGSFFKGTPAFGLIGTLHCLYQTNISQDFQVTSWGAFGGRFWAYLQHSAGFLWGIFTFLTRGCTSGQEGGSPHPWLGQQCERFGTVVCDMHWLWCANHWWHRQFHESAPLSCDHSSAAPSHYCGPIRPWWLVGSFSILWSLRRRPFKRMMQDWRSRRMQLSR